MRLACVYVPQLALQAALRRNPEARDEPAALLETSGPGTRRALAGFAGRSSSREVRNPRRVPRNEAACLELESRARRAACGPA